MASRDILPDSRPRHQRGHVYVVGLGWMVPVYCINCGKRWGLVQERLITHVTALCDTGCADVYGDAANFMADSDAKIREDLAECLATDYKKLDAQVRYAAALDKPTAALAALARDWHARTSRVN